MNPTTNSNTTTLMNATSSDHVAVLGKCARRGCRETDQPQACMAPGCDRFFHLSCFQNKYGNEQWTAVQPGQVVCKKECYTKLAAQGKVRHTWTNDGAGGVEDSNSSERILLNWLLTPGNYSLKWRGKNNNGQRKKQIAEVIAKLMNDAKVKVKRDAKQVMNKVQHIEEQFRRAHDWANTETGTGLQREDKGNFNDSIRKMCPYYFDILEVFGDRASAKPKATSNDNLDSSEDDEEDADDNVEEAANELEETGTGDDLSVPTNDKSSKTGIKKKREGGTIAAGRKKKPPSISLINDAASAASAAYAQTKSRLAEAKMSEIKRSALTKEQLDAAELEKKKAEAKEAKTKTTTFLIKELKQVRSDNPELSDEAIVALYPDFQEIIKYFKRDE